MGRAPCCDKANVKRGPWSPEEDTTLRNYVQRHGTGGNWIALPQKAGLKRCGKSCRLRWLNYLRPDIKHGGFTEEEDNIICNLYQSMGSRWSVIASHLPRRTDNDVKNYWNTKLKKKLMVSKTNLPAIVNTSAKRNHIQFSSPQLPQVIKTESYASTSVSESSTSLSSMEFGFGYDAEFHRWLTDPNSFSPPALKESSDFGAGATGFGASSSSVPMNNGFNPFSATGGGEVDGFFMDLSYVPSYGLFNGYGLQEKMGEAAPGLSNFPYTNMVANSDTNSQGFYQRC